MTSPVVAMTRQEARLLRREPAAMAWGSPSRWPATSS